MSAQVSRADNVMAQLLLVRPAPTYDRDGAGPTRSAENALTFSLIFSGGRCILQYALLPFLLPVAGIAADAAVPILLVINVLAIASIYFSLRRFWTILYAHRWRYLVVAATALILLMAFTIYDIIQLSGPGA
ncbi:MAG: hypothetical protein OXG85_06295 [Chloroflexi bacterium]|nr:hypothetical protein [Chloroflexota bacterium]